MTQGEHFPDEYIERCFTVWYSLNQPNNFEVLQEAIPILDGRDKPSKTLLRKFRDTYGWVERADGLTALAVQRNDELLVNSKADMLRQMATDAAEIRAKAKKFLMENDFDTSTSASNTYFKASEEERAVRGVSEMVIKISKMTNEELEARRVKLLRRQNEAVDAEVLEDSHAERSIE